LLPAVFAMNMSAAQELFVRDGCVLLPGVLSVADCRLWRERIAELDAAGENPGIRKRGEAVYAMRNLIDLCPRLDELWRREKLLEFLRMTFGPRFGLVRGLLFDKPPDQTWAVPWHQDVSIAIEPSAHPSPRFSPPRLKADVWHCTAPPDVLERMVTLRIHLDSVTDANGPLEVAPGTHRAGIGFDPSRSAVRRILAEAGDVLAMRPLLAHASPRSAPGATLHRRVVHLEFAADPELPDGYRWRWFVRGD
jgi:hypothetical protein